MGGRLGREPGSLRAVNPTGILLARAGPTHGPGGSGQVSVGLAGHSTDAPRGYGTRMLGVLRRRLCTSSARGCCALRGFTALRRGCLGTQHPLSTAAPQAVPTGPPQRGSHPRDTCTGRVVTGDNAPTCPDEGKSKGAPRGFVPGCRGVPESWAGAEGQVPTPCSSLASGGRCPAHGASRATATEHHGCR